MRKLILMLLMGCLLILMMAGVLSAADKPTYGCTFTAFSGTDPISWDPYAHHSGGGDYWTMGSVYERLTGADWAVDRKEFPMTMIYIPAKFTIGTSMDSYEMPNASTYVVHIHKEISADLEIKRFLETKVTGH